jgi:hypothetical protein
VTPSAAPTDLQKFRFLATSTGSSTFQIAPNSSSTVFLVLRTGGVIGFDSDTTKAWTVVNVQDSSGQAYTFLLSTLGEKLYLVAAASEPGSAVKYGYLPHPISAAEQVTNTWTLTPVA